MGLDYTDGCVNFRDVGEFINLIAGQQIFPLNKIHRGGTTDYIKDIDEIGHPKTIINLRKGTDLHEFDTDYYHFPISNKYEKYHTEQKEVQRWLNEIIQLFENEDLKYPVFIHCLSGKDRTGIVVAALLTIVGIPEEFIIEEYLLSDGEVLTERIKRSLDGFRDLPNYFKRIDLELVKKNVIGAAGASS